MKLSFSALVLCAVGLATTVLAGDFVANSDESFIVTSVPGGAYYAATPGGCVIKMSDLGDGYLFDLSTLTADKKKVTQKPKGSAHVFETHISTPDAGRSWFIDIANALPYNWATSYIWYNSGSVDGKDVFTVGATKRVSPGGTLAYGCGDCKDDSAFGTNIVVATYSKDVIGITAA